MLSLESENLGILVLKDKPNNGSMVSENYKKPCSEDLCDKWEELIID